MKYLCIKSHEQPDPEPGKFKLYEAGEEYELAEADEALFRPVYGTMEQGNRVPVNQNIIQNDADTVGSVHKGRKKT